MDCDCSCNVCGHVHHPALLRGQSVQHGIPHHEPWLERVLVHGGGWCGRLHDVQGHQGQVRWTGSIQLPLAFGSSEPPLVMPLQTDMGLQLV